MTGRNILITGGAGFLGVNLAERLAPENEVTLLDLALGGTLPYSPLAHDEGVKKIAADVRDAEPLAALIAECDVVIHAAALLGVRRVVERPRDTIDTIVLGTRNVLEAVRRAGRPIEVINFSSSEVYGNVARVREGEPARVGTTRDPRSSYAAAKLLAEHLCWAYRSEFGVPVCTIRPFNVYGPRRCGAHAVGIFAVQALAGVDLTVYGSGESLRSWCYVDDFCEGVLAALDTPAAFGEDINLGGPDDHVSVKHLAETIAELAGSGSQVRTVAPPFSDIGARHVDTEKARQLLGYEPQIDLETGLERTLTWYRKHLAEFPHWLEPGA